MPKLTKDFIIKANNYYNRFNLKADCEKAVNQYKNDGFTPMEFAEKGLSSITKKEDSYIALAYMMAALNQKGEMSDIDKQKYVDLVSVFENEFDINEKQLKSAQQYFGKKDKDIDSLLHEINEDGSIVTAKEIRDKEAEEKEKENSPEAKEQRRKEAMAERLRKEAEEDELARQEEERERAAREKEENDLKAQAKEEADKPYTDYIKAKHKELKDLDEANNIKNKIIIDKDFLNELNIAHIRGICEDPDPTVDGDNTTADFCKGWRAEAKDNAEDKWSRLSDQRDAAVTRFQVYLGLRDKLENKSFLDILRHPINTIREAIQMIGAKNDLKSAYGLSNDAIENVHDMIMVEKKKNIPSDFGIMDKDGTIHPNKAPQKDIDAKYNELKAAKSKEKLVDKTKDLRNDLSEMGKDVKINNEKVQEKQQVINKDLNIE